MRFTWTALAATLAVSAPAAAQVPQPAGNPDYAATSWLVAHGRGADQAAHPDYQRLMVPRYAAGAQAGPGWERTFFTDPYLAVEGPQRADWLEVSFANRYGARMAATMIAPRTPGPHPAIVIEPGGSGPRYGFLNLAQGLAESGYVTLTIAPQGDAEADAAPADPVPATPENERCRPHDFGNWQAGEGGVSEDGACAGQEPPVPPLGPTAFAEAVAGDDHRPLDADPVYRASRARKAFGVLDATRWLVSPANPWRARVDATRLGAAGHSVGAQGAMVAGQIDTQNLIDAVVAWDGFGPLDHIAPRVPTMFQHAEARIIGPHHRQRDPDGLPQAAIAASFRAAGVPSALVTLANSTHQEWNYLPYLGVTVGALVLAGNPTAAENAAASSLGERVALHYTLAWFDHFLRGAPDAVGRLRARTFDGSTDRVAIGQGRWSPLRQRNEPYTIAGRSVTAHLSPDYTSRLDMPGLSCPSLRTAC